MFLSKALILDQWGGRKEEEGFDGEVVV